MLARLAEAVVADDPGVCAISGGRYTRDGDREIPGVAVTAGADGRVDLDLHLLAYMPPRPFEEQAESIRKALQEAARRTGTAERLGQIEVTIDDVIAPTEIAKFWRSDDGTNDGDAA